MYRFLFLLFIPIIRNNAQFGCVKASKINDRKWRCIQLIICHLRSLICRQLSRKPNCALFLIMGIRIPVFSVASSAVVALAATGQTVVYPIESNQRGTEIVNTFQSLARASGVQVPEVAFQTSVPSSSYATYRYIVNGIIPYIQNITQTTYNTLLIVSYIAPQAPSTTQYLVLPTEQITALLYFPTLSNLPTSSNPFNASYSNGILPFFSVDPKLRAVDIVSAATKLMAAPFKLPSSSSQVWIQTNLSGPFNPPLANGLLKNVVGISVNNSLIRIQYQPPNQPVLTLIAAPEQIQQIIFILNPSYP